MARCSIRMYGAESCVSGAAAGTPQEAMERFTAHAKEVGGRLKHGWFRDGVTHPNSDLPPDGLPRLTWEEKVVPKFNQADLSTYTPTQMVGLCLSGFGLFVTGVSLAISSSSSASASKALRDRDAEMTAKEN